MTQPLLSSLRAFQFYRSYSYNTIPPIRTNPGSLTVTYTWLLASITAQCSVIAYYNRSQLTVDTAFNILHLCQSYHPEFLAVYSCRIWPVGTKVTVSIHFHLHVYKIKGHDRTIYYSYCITSSQILLPQHHHLHKQDSSDPIRPRQNLTVQERCELDLSMVEFCTQALASSCSLPDPEGRRHCRIQR